MPTLSPLTILREALDAVPGYAALPAAIFPTLPILEVTAFGQQHLLTTFALEPPAATLLPTGAAVLAVSLHLLLPDGYTYWQPETGTSHYLQAVQHPADLPAPYAQLLAERVAQLAAATPYSAAALADYLPLLVKVAERGWLLGDNPDSAAENAVALRLQTYLPALCEPDLTTFYQGRGSRLLVWMANSTYEPNWVETALATLWRTMPDWAATLPGPEAVLRAAVPVPAVLDGLACLVVAFYAVVPAEAAHLMRLYLPGAVGYIAYPDGETYWRPLRGVEHFAVFTLPHDTAGRPYIETPIQTLSTHESNLSYQQLIASLLVRRWLHSHQHQLKPTGETMATTQALQPYLAELATSPLAPFYAVEALPLVGWLRQALQAGKDHVAAG